MNPCAVARARGRALPTECADRLPFADSPHPRCLKAASRWSWDRGRRAPGDPGRAFRRRGVADIAHEFSVRHAVDAHVEYCRARPDPFTRNKLRLADRRRRRLPRALLRPHISRAGMAHGDRRAREQQLERHADGPRCSMHPTTVARAPFEFDAVRLRETDDAVRRARAQTRALLRKQPRVRGVKAVRVLGGIDRVHHAVGVEAFRQRQLDQDAVDAIVVVQRASPA